MKPKVTIAHLSPFHKQPTKADVERLAPLIGMMRTPGVLNGACSLQLDNTRALNYQGMANTPEVVETEAGIAAFSVIGRMGAAFIHLGDPVYFATEAENAVMPVTDLSKPAGWGTAVDVCGDSAVKSGGPKRVAGQIFVSKMLFRLAPIAAALYVERQIHAAISGAIDKAAFSGSGVGMEPLGLTLNPAVNSTAGPVTLAKIAAAEKAIGAGYCETMPVGLIGAPDVRETLRTSFVNGTGSASIWDSLTDIEKTASSHLATGVSILGDWSNMTVLQWGGLDLSLNPYTNDTEGKIKMLIEAWVDIVPLRPGAFEVIQPA
jgi:hypothetical protein